MPKLFCSAWSVRTIMHIPRNKLMKGVEKWKHDFSFRQKDKRSEQTFLEGDENDAYEGYIINL